VFRILLLAFIVVPIAELYVIIQVGSAIGGWETIGLLVLDSVVGAWLVRREGFSILAKVQGSLANGELPTNSLIDGLLVLVAGALMLTPGFLTDGLGLVLLLPPSRTIVRTALKKRFAGRITVGGGPYGGPFGGRDGGGITDVRWTENPPTGPDGRDEPPGPIELGPVSD
jgi:UPF0716 protein FxsA